MKLKSYISLGIASAAAVLGGANAAEAAALQGRVGINPPSPVNGIGSGVILSGTGTSIPGTDLPATNFDFVPPVNGGTGAVVELNANPINGENDFAPFIGETGDIQDISNDQILAIAGGATQLDDFILIPGAFSVTLTDVEASEYTFDGSGTTVSVGVAGDFINLSDGSGDVSSGVGTFSVDFAGLTIDETQELFDEPGEVPEGFTPGTWSSNFVVTADDVPPQPPQPPVPPTVPEASNLLGLLVIGLGGASMMIRKK